MSDYRKQEISDEEDHHHHPPQNINNQQTYQSPTQPHSDHPTEQAPQVTMQPHNNQSDHHNHQQQVHKQSKGMIDHEGISRFANFSLDLENDHNNEVYLRIVANQTKGSGFNRYTAYVIKGHDRNGEVLAYRRFSQFHALRGAMVQRWPGCFIPSIPTKNFMHKNDKDETIKRQRYLNDFVIKMTKLPHLYNSEEFQAFLRSKQVDTSNIYASWSLPTNEAIINKYRDCFSGLAGKTIDSSTNDTISHFYARVKKNGPLLEKYRATAKSLALSFDKFQSSLPKVFSKVIPCYERNMLFEYVDGKENCLVYENPDQAKLNEHSAVIVSSTAKNPYWSLYDMIKHEERDGRAFLEALDAREKLQNKKFSLQNQMRDNERAIQDLMSGKTNFKSVTMKGTKQEIKYKLEMENEELKKEKSMLLNLSDIISALIVYIEIPAYQFAKINFYNKTIQKIGGFELNAVQIQADVWKDAFLASKKIGSTHQQGL